MPTRYDLQPVHLPHLAGVPLRLFVQALENPLSRGPLIQNLLRLVNAAEQLVERRKPALFYPASFTV